MSIERVEGHVPPHDLDAEAAVLSAVMVDKLAFDKVADRLEPEQFYSEAHRRIWEACVELARDGKPIDVVNVATKLKDMDRIAQVGGMPYLTEILNSAPAVANVDTYAATVFDRWQGRQAIFTCQKYQAAGYAALGAYGGGSGLVQALADEVYALTCTDSRTQVELIRGVLRQSFRAIQDAQNRGSRVVGIATGFDRYDRLTSGLHPGELTIVAARPGMGKTSLMLQIARNAAALPVPSPAPDAQPDADPPPPKAYGAIIFSLEMGRELLVNRLLCCEARVDLSRARTGMLSPSDWTKLTQAAQTLAGRNLWIDDQPGINLVQLRSKVRRTMSRASAEGVQIALVAVDYLQLMAGAGNEATREQEVSGISRGLKNLSRELNLPIVALSQLNRAVESRGGDRGKRPQLSDLRESGAIEQDADNICFIYRDDYYNKESPERAVAELIIAKQRNGPTDTVKVRFDAQYTRFENLPDGYESDESGGYE